MDSEDSYSDPIAPPYSPITSSESDNCDVVPDQQETAQEVASTEIQGNSYSFCAWLTISIHSASP